VTGIVLALALAALQASPPAGGSSQAGGTQARGAQPVSAQIPSSQTGSTQTGRELYLKYSCYACHGYDGHGGAGARLVPMRMSLPAFTAYVHNPRRIQMPQYTAAVLTDTQLADLFAYIKALPESPAAKDIPLLMRIINSQKQ
jgi:mono/diheme cytochrome c family protein